MASAKAVLDNHGMEKVRKALKWLADKLAAAFIGWTWNHPGTASMLISPIWAAVQWYGHTIANGWTQANLADRTILAAGVFLTVLGLILATKWAIAVYRRDPNKNGIVLVILASLFVIGVTISVFNLSTTTRVSTLSISIWYLARQTR